jgi:hypothetical protein
VHLMHISSSVSSMSFLNLGIFVLILRHAVPGDGMNSQQMYGGQGRQPPPPSNDSGPMGRCLSPGRDALQFEGRGGSDGGGARYEASEMLALFKPGNYSIWAKGESCRSSRLIIHSFDDVMHFFWQMAKRAARRIFQLLR